MEKINIIFITTVTTFSILALLLIYFLYYYKGKVWGLLASLIGGFVGLITLLVLVNATSFNSESILQTTGDVFNYPGQIFINLILIMVPIYLIFVISSLVFSENFGNVKKRTYGISFASLLLLSLFGIIIAMMLVPIISLIPNSIWDNAINAGEIETITRHSEGNFSFNWIILIVFGTIVLTFAISLIMRLTMKDKVENFRNTTKRVSTWITLYYKVVLQLVPLVLLTRLTSIGMTNEMNEATSKLLVMGIYLALYFIGAIIIFITLYLYILFVSDDNKSIKERMSIINKYILTIFANQSLVASLEETQLATQELGVCEEISKLTPTKGLFMGMVMCNGFTPMIMISFLLAAAGALTIGNVLLAGIFIFTLSISTSGAGSSDLWITVTATKMLGVTAITDHIFDAIYLDIILVAHELNELTVAKPIDAIGHVSATLTTDIYHRRVSECEHCVSEYDKLS